MFERPGADREVTGDLTRWEPSLWSVAASAMSQVGVAVAMGVATCLFLIVAVGLHSSAGFWFFPAAAVGVGAAHASRPAFWARVRAARAAASLALPDPQSVRDEAAQAILRRLHESRSRLIRAQDCSPFGQGHALSRSGAALRELDRRALILIARVEHIHRLLSESQGRSLGSQVERLRAAGDAAASAEAVETYERAATVATVHRELLHRLELRRERCLATLEHLAGVIETLPAKLTELDLARVDACDEALAGTLSVDGVLAVIDDAISSAEA